jgi:hypothetical protein
MASMADLLQAFKGMSNYKRQPGYERRLRPPEVADQLKQEAEDKRQRRRERNLGLRVGAIDAR